MTCLKNKLIILMLSFISFTFNIVPLLSTFNHWELPCFKGVSCQSAQRGKAVSCDSLRCLHWIFNFYFMGMNVSACVYVYASRVCLLAKEVRRRHQIPQNWSHGWL